jgi:outer membrane protein assembly factor BamC
MQKSPLLALASSVVVVLALGCSSPGSLLESKKIDYKSAEQIRPLEVPPNLTAPTQEDRYAIPDSKGQGPATLSVYNKERGSQEINPSTVLPQIDKVRMEKNGSQRWLVVKAEPDAVWPVVKEFWQETGFILKLEAPDAGIMETDWAENRAKIPQDAIRNVIGKVFDGLYSTSERDKFRTRLERGGDPGTTEVYVSHRGMIEVYTREGQKETRWQPRPIDPELEAEMLNRIASRFAGDEARAKAALQAPPPAQEKAKLTKKSDGTSDLSIQESFDRAWNRVGLALDRVGFTVEDRDRSKGLYFVRYIDPKDDNQVKPAGFFARIFGRDPKPSEKDERYRIQLSNAGESTSVQVQDKQGSAEKSGAAGKILALLYEQLR